ncbi:MAG TPA: arginyltransferase [Bryobacteraceae bacterium]|jgi:arginine-tRNA-protein transferase|nr:arginyltransferase [Bryobacteraceae bacterium]
MKELFRVIESPRTCSYLPNETASLEFRAIAAMRPEEYGDLLARGYRRFGWQVFRPACSSCTQCRSLRVAVPQFALNASDRRVLRKNEHVRVELHPLFVTREHVELYNRYQAFMHEHRGWELRTATISSYRDSFLSGEAELGRQWLFFEADRLIGVALMDQAPEAISLVYFFHDPRWRSRSPGRFSILKQLLYAKEQGLRYAYLGYWIERCGSMNYKNRFRPHEILAEYVPDEGTPVWI